LESEPIFMEMGRWATRSMRHDPTLFLSPASAMMSFRTMIDRKLAADLQMTIAFRFPTDSFVGEIAGGDIVIHRGETDAADATFITDTTTMAFTVYGKVPFEEHEKIGKLAIEGDRAAAERFVSLFNLPGKIAP
jgi:alkyl sulfatase BDS1-like metallo-beta-lactamase superfamily hydrolase